MATYTARAQSIITALLDAAPTASQQNRIADAFVAEYPQFFRPADPLNPTNNEKAACFVLALRYLSRRVLRSAAQDAAQDTAEADIQAAGDAAEADL